MKIQVYRYSDKALKRARQDSDFEATTDARFIKVMVPPFQGKGHRHVEVNKPHEPELLFLTSDLIIVGLGDILIDFKDFPNSHFTLDSIVDQDDIRFNLPSVSFIAPEQLEYIGFKSV